MSTRNPVGMLVLAAVIVCTPAMAEDVEKKFRIGLAVGQLNATDEVGSDSANVMTLVDENFVLEDRYIDPRDDSAVFGNLDIQSGFLVSAYGQYALSKVFLVELSVGYQKTDVGDVEVQGQFAPPDVDVEDFDFRTFRIPVGDLERVPIQLTALARFRPRATFNPYVGLGIGYTLIGFESDPAFDELSRNMDASMGGQAEVSSALYGNPTLRPPDVGTETDLAGATVDARDTFEWHLAGGAEYTFRRNWALFVDLRWTMASRSMSVGFNGGKDLGVAVPQLLDYEDSPAASETYGPILITVGGLLDGGSERPEGCNLGEDDCVFDSAAQDGQLDTGYYYAQGGKIDYDGVSVQVGVRYTF